jgi:hypothetical protein
MRSGALVACCLVITACDLHRDLESMRFACGLGEPCTDASVPDVSDAGAADAAVADAAMPPPPPPCELTFSPCGGELSGRYRYRSACTPYAFSTFFACNGTGESQSITVTGTVAFTPSDLNAVCSVSYDEKILIPDGCASRAGGCAAVSAYLGAADFGATSCEQVGGGCECHTAGSEGCVDSGGYSTSTTSFTTQASSKTYDYCAQGQSLIYGSSRADNYGHRFVFVLERF